MKKREFLKLSSAVLTSVALTPLISCEGKKEVKKEVLKNWAGNLTYSTQNIHRPKNAAEVKAVVDQCTKLRALGTQHCFNTIADSEFNLISTKGLTEIGPIDEKASTITVGAGIRYGDLCKFLYEKGYALHNLASLPHISVAGACATATHGSGVTNGNLSTGVSGLELVTGTGEVRTLTRTLNPDIFSGTLVNLGALGVVTKITLDLLPAFDVRQTVYLGLPLTQLENHFDEIMSSGYSVSLFTDWQTDNINQVWIKRIARKNEPFTPEPEFFGARLADRDVHPIIEISAENCTPQMSVAGPWYERLPHFKLDFTPSSGEELQAEYFVPRDKAVEAIKAVTSLRDELRNILFITEIRTIDADELWMSPCYNQKSVAIHFTLKQEFDGVSKFLPHVEEKLAPFNVRPHWGKLSTISPGTLQSRYEKLADFVRLAKEFDPNGKFRNQFLEKGILLGS
ncbi:MAG TPA: D-arabinono-1,4-lactone oxidase [Chryseolinea sp.]|nr:D-arabinono-1,4-lactone oxidase [Chryseolinea sp.]